MRTHTLTLAATLVLLLGSGAASYQAEDTSSPKLRVEWDEFKKLYDKKQTVIVDVRSADNFEAGHIPGSRSIPLDQVEKHVDELKKLQKPIVTYCA